MLQLYWVLVIIISMIRGEIIFSISINLLHYVQNCIKLIRHINGPCEYHCNCMTSYKLYSVFIGVLVCMVFLHNTFQVWCVISSVLPLTEKMNSPDCAISSVLPLTEKMNSPDCIISSVFLSLRRWTHQTV